jgi:hypothetical protein
MISFYLVKLSVHEAELSEHDAPAARLMLPHTFGGVRGLASQIDVATK